MPECITASLAALNGSALTCPWGVDRIKDAESEVFASSLKQGSSRHIYDRSYNITRLQIDSRNTDRYKAIAEKGLIGHREEEIAAYICSNVRVLARLDVTLTGLNS